MNKNIVKINNEGASLLEVLIAMIILTVAFLGVMALSISLLKNNSLSTKINTATSIAQMQVSQLNCLGLAGVPSYFNASPIVVPAAECPAGATCYEYEITPTVTNPVTGSDTRSTVGTALNPKCINSALNFGGPAPGGLPSNYGIGITTPYVVKITFEPNPEVSAAAYNAQVDVGWDVFWNAANTQIISMRHVITMYNTIS